MAHILVMEDEEEFGQLISASLERAGHVVTLRHNATSAESAFKKNEIDLVIADIIVRQNGQSVPDGGLTLITKIRRTMQQSNPKLPIIAISGVTHYPGMHSVLSIAASLGASAALRKPFAPSKLLEMIDDLLENGREGLEEGQT